MSESDLCSVGSDAGEDSKGSFSCDNVSDAGNNDSCDGEVITAEEAQVISEFPDSSADVDFDDLRYKRLVDFFLINGNKKKSAELAGFKAKNDASLRAIASKAFTRADVKTYFKLRKAELKAKADISQDAYMAELISIATFDIGDVVETHAITDLTGENVYTMSFKNIEDIPTFARKAVKAIEIDKNGTPKMTFYDKLGALKMLGEIKGYLAKSDSDIAEEEYGIANIPAILPDNEDGVSGE